MGNEIEEANKGQDCVESDQLVPDDAGVWGPAVKLKAGGRPPRNLQGASQLGGTTTVGTQGGAVGLHQCAVA